MSVSSAKRGQLPTRTILLSAAQRRELGALADQLQGKDRRQRRYEYHVDGGVVLVLTQAGGRRVRYQVEPVNISAGGVGLLHNAFVQPDTTCSVVLKTVDGELFEVLGKAAHCECLRAPVHYVGIQFDQQVDVNLFIRVSVAPDDETTSDALTAKQREVIAGLAMELHCLAQVDCRPTDLRPRCLQLCKLLGIAVKEG